MSHGGNSPYWLRRPSFGDPPVGALMAFAGCVGTPMPATAAPLRGSSGDNGYPIEAWGWMLCDGRTLSIYHYFELFEVLGYLYGGSGDSFQIPDYRGYFLRGANVGGGADPDVDARTGPNGAKEEEKGCVGSTQSFALQAHEHTYSSAKTAAPPAPQGTAAGAPLGEPTLTTGGPTSSLSPPGNVQVSAHETRPVNIYVNYIIKFTSGLRTAAF